MTASTQLLLKVKACTKGQRQPNFISPQINETTERLPHHFGKIRQNHKPYFITHLLITMSAGDEAPGSTAIKLGTATIVCQS